MVIEIDRNVFKERNFKGLNFFLQMCTYKSRYKVYTEINEELLTSNEFKRLDYEDQSLLQDNYNNFITNQSIASDIFLISNYFITTEINEEVNNFTIDEAIRYFIQPISIVLENSKNDAYFINAVFTHFATDNQIQNHLNNNWIQFENAGGCDNIINFLEGKKQSFNSLPKSDKSKYLRCFVLMDSDKLHFSYELKENKIKTLNYLDNNNISYHILEKRSIENYVPKEVFINLDNRYNTWLDAFQALSEEQKDFFSIENGLCGVDKNQNPKKSEEQINLDTNNLFNNILIGSLKTNILVNGLKHQGYGSFKENFPKLFESPNTNTITLKGRANSMELENIVQKIKNLL
ncbi:hypothetical protein ACHRV5_04770 [Flavobacterium sp. FlaQc-52]|jgi:hypothetical protein|uniref:hypothetical protein n=1 Tax=Flavobacterium sp. FlaQc-52 TaxID=3374185 RepID=UPI003757A4E8